jgi:internalin A
MSMLIRCRMEERSGLLALHAILRDKDPHHEKLGLLRVPTYTGDYLWLCRKHYDESQSKIPDEITFPDK